MSLHPRFRASFVLLAALATGGLLAAALSTVPVDAPAPAREAASAPASPDAPAAPALDRAVPAPAPATAVADRAGRARAPVARPADRPLRAVFAPALAGGALWARQPQPVFASPQDRTLALYGHEPLDMEHPAIRSVAFVQEAYTGVLMEHPAVVGTGVGLTDDGELGIVVLTRFDMGGRLPVEIDGVPVVLWETGEIAAFKKPGGGGGGGTTIDPKTKFTRPVPIGVSAGVLTLDDEDEPKIFTGTYGCRLTNGAAIYALSNNHVFADEGLADIGSPILQPGTLDGGTSTDNSIGTLHSFVPIQFGGTAENKVDAAIASITFDGATPRAGFATPANGYGAPESTVRSPALSLGVKKYGRTSSLTSSTISALNGTTLVGYDAGAALFVQQIYVKGNSFLKAGDSGSLVVANGGADDRRPVGLGFAGGGGVAVVNRMSDVLAELATAGGTGTLTVDDGAP